MPTFTLMVREAGRLLGETEVKLPELTFVPETAVSHVGTDGRETPFLGWGGRLWIGLHEPSADESGVRRPLSPESFAQRVNEVADGNPFGARTIRNPFNPDRFLHPLASSSKSSRTAVLEARLAEVRAAARGLAVIEGIVHRAVQEPVHVVNMGRGSVRVDTRFDDDTSGAPRIVWNVFRADRGQDAEVFAAELAASRSLPLAEPSGWLRVVYSQILMADDVGGAFGEAFRRFQGLGLPDRSRLAERIAALPKDLADPAAAEEAYTLLGQVREELDRALDLKGDMRHEAAVEVCSLVATRYESVDRDWLKARTAAPVFAP